MDHNVIQVERFMI